MIFNNNLLTQNLLWGPNEMRDSSEEEAVLLDRYGERYSELAKYVDCLKGLHCPQAGCNVFLLSRSVDGLYELRLRSHLHDEHKLGWDETEACAREAIAAQKDTV